MMVYKCFMLFIFTEEVITEQYLKDNFTLILYDKQFVTCFLHTWILIRRKKDYRLISF